MKNSSDSPLYTVEVGGSSTQYCELIARAIVPSAQPRAKDIEWLLATAGIVVGDHVRGAHHIGWGDVSAREQLGMVHSPLISMNDAEAAALGEWYLNGSQGSSLLYLGLGTGIGSGVVIDGNVFDVDISHATDFGPKVCGGCGAKGCLDAQVGGHALSNPLTPEDREQLLATLAAAINRLNEQPSVVVLAGGIARRFPDLVASLSARIGPNVVPTAAEPVLKSAAPWGLFYRWKTEFER